MIRGIASLHTVYNFEVHVEHAYNVSALGILVHNPPSAPKPGDQAGKLAIQGEQMVNRLNQLNQQAAQLKAAMQAEQNVLEAMRMQRELAAINEEISMLRATTLGWGGIYPTSGP